MRILVMFDLPTYTSIDIREYRRFRKFLIKNGFIMMQESIYTKLVLNPSSAELVRKQVRKEIPKEGLVQMITITEKQFASMELLIGETQSVCIDNDKRLIEL
ncbi:MAG: CRISPR-associated endonuclease Cas2 [Clostridia bacterium]|nr:CRISPR-associated endonuclease Cas2 [Clostridia bacterium]